MKIDQNIMDEFEKECALLQKDGIKNSRLRKQYEDEVHKLQQLAQKLVAQHGNTDEVARQLHDMRRAIGFKYKKAAPPLFCEYIYAATAAKYGDPLGPTYEQLRRTKTPEQIIASASTPIKDLDARLTLDGFVQWFNQQKINKI